MFRSQRRGLGSSRASATQRSAVEAFSNHRSASRAASLLAGRDWMDCQALAPAMSDAYADSSSKGTGGGSIPAAKSRQRRAEVEPVIGDLCACPVDEECAPPGKSRCFPTRCRRGRSHRRRAGARASAVSSAESASSSHLHAQTRARSSALPSDAQTGPVEAVGAAGRPWPKVRWGRCPGEFSDRPEKLVAAASRLVTPLRKRCPNDRLSDFGEESPCHRQPRGRR